LCSASATCNDLSYPLPQGFIKAITCTMILRI
jgi:hypothetical protein